MKRSLLILDVDGTLTDGKIHISSEGEQFKSFHVKDGLAIKHILPIHNIIPIIITGRKSEVTEKRAKELDITHIYQGVENKASLLLQIAKEFHCLLDDIAYIGDDINDLEAMKLVGNVGCPSDAVKEVTEIAHYICEKKGGEGAVREYIEWLLSQ